MGILSNQETDISTFLHLISSQAQENGKNKGAKLILTANQRQARFLIKEVSQRYPVFDASSLLIQPLNAWLFQLCEQNLSSVGRIDDDIQLLKPGFEERVVWQNVVDNSEIPVLINQADLVAQLMSAYQICETYLIPDSELADSELEETKLYLDLRNHYYSHLKTHNTIDLIQSVKLQNTSNKLIGNECYLFGFSEIPPLYEQIIEQQCFSKVSVLKNTITNPDIDIYHAKNEQVEIKTAAAWALDKIKAGEDNISIVVPNLNELHNKVFDTFFRVLEPENYANTSGQAIPTLFDISISDSLAHTAIAKTLIALSKLTRPSLAKEELAYLLRSPYWGNGYSNYRQRLFSILEHLLDRKTSLFELESIADKKLKNKPRRHLNATENSDEKTQHSLSHDNDSDTDLHSIRAIRNFKNKFTGNKSYSEWVSLYLEYLSACGYPGPQPISSYEYQALQRCIQELKSLRNLDSMYQQGVNFFTFTKTLNLKLENTAFHPEVKQPKVHVLGLMEASGLAHESTLVLGLTEQNIPARPAPHPFLSLTLQNKYATPKSSASRELDYAEQFLGEIIRSSRRLTLSYHLDQEGLSCKPSPLLSHQLGAHLNDSEAWQSTEPDAFECILNEHIAHESFDVISTGKAPEVKQGESIRGGTYHLSLYQVNPMLSYFKFRLNIQEPREESQGVTKLERGIYVHALLREIYEIYPSKASLQTYYERACFKENLYERAQLTLLHESNQGRLLPPLVERFETERLCAQAQAIIHQDCQRSVPFDIQALETNAVFDVNGRKITVQIDRIDKIGDAVVVFDYKTGKNSVSSLLKQTMTDFQLPIYSLSLSHYVNGAAYIELDTRSAAYKGLADENIDLPGLSQPENMKRVEVEKTWSELLAHWSDEIERTVEDIVSGYVPYEERIQAKQSYFEYLKLAIRDEDKGIN